MDHPHDKSPANVPLDQQRRRWLRRLGRRLDAPMTALAFVWLLLLILDFTRGLGRFEAIASDAIWAIFVLHFVVEWLIAPRKLLYLRRRWLTAISIALPAFRVLRAFRLLRLARLGRSLGLVRLATSLNRAMAATRRVAGRYGISYVFALTVVVTFSGAAGMYQFENDAALAEAGFARGANAGLTSYWDALWWTAMIVTTMGSEYWPQTAEGRLLAWLLALYAFAIFGYLTAAIASLFVGQDRRSAEQAQAAEASRENALLRDEISLLRAEVRRLVERLDGSTGRSGDAAST